MKRNKNILVLLIVNINQEVGAKKEKKEITEEQTITERGGVRLVDFSALLNLPN